VSSFSRPLIFFQAIHNPHETISAGSHCIFEFPGPSSVFPYQKNKSIFFKLVNTNMLTNSILHTKLASKINLPIRGLAAFCKFSPSCCINNILNRRIIFLLTLAVNVASLNNDWFNSNDLNNKKSWEIFFSFFFFFFVSFSFSQ